MSEEVEENNNVPRQPYNAFDSLDNGFPRTFETKCSLRPDCPPLRTTGSAQDLDYDVWPEVLRSKMEKSRQAKKGGLHAIGFCTSSSEFEPRLCGGVKRPSSDGGGDLRCTASRTSVSASPRGSYLGSWASSPERPSVLPLTPVGSEGNLAALGYESPGHEPSSPASSFLGFSAGESLPMLSLLDSRTSPEGSPGLPHSPMLNPGTPAQMGPSLLGQEPFSLCPPAKKRPVYPDDDAHSCG